MIRADLLVTGLGEVATLADGPAYRTGAAMTELGRIEQAAVAADDGRFVFVGPERAATREVRLRSGGQKWDAAGAVALPGFVDAHTHVLFAGDRSNEVALKVEGKSYLDIAHAGGGLYSTVRATRAASSRALLDSATRRLRSLHASGVTSVEVKSGYALNHAGELRLLSLVPSLARRTGLSLVPTYLGAHAVPPEFSGRSDAYVQEIVTKTLPDVARRRLAKFCDVFCEPGFFDPTQSERILRAALSLGLGAKIHAEEFVVSGGAQLAARLAVTSAEHLVHSTADDARALANAGVTAVLLPVTPFASITRDRSPGRELVDAGVPVALGSDLCPNSWVESMPVVLAHAVYSARLRPAEAICAATVNAAHAVGLDDVAGQIRPGRPADFVVFDVPKVENVADRIGLVPERVYRQGKRAPPA